MQNPTKTGSVLCANQHGAIGQEKTPTENGWGFIIGGGGGNRTRVRRFYVPGSTCVARRSISSRGNTTRKAHPGTSRFGVSLARPTARFGDSVMMTLHRRARTQAGSGLGLKRPERSCRRWQLRVCGWINEESCPLGMHQAISISPSKPIAPGLKAPLSSIHGFVAGMIQARHSNKRRERRQVARRRSAGSGVYVRST